MIRWKSIIQHLIAWKYSWIIKVILFEESRESSKVWFERETIFWKTEFVTVNLENNDRKFLWMKTTVYPGHTNIEWYYDKEKFVKIFLLIFLLMKLRTILLNLYQHWKVFSFLRNQTSLFSTEHDSCHGPSWRQRSEWIFRSLYTIMDRLQLRKNNRLQKEKQTSWMHSKSLFWWQTLVLSFHLSFWEELSRRNSEYMLNHSITRLYQILFRCISLILKSLLLRIVEARGYE